MATHELYQVEPLGQGITIHPDNFGYGAFGVTIRGSDHSEIERPFFIRFDLKMLNQIKEITEMLNDEREKFDTREKQIQCSHPEVKDGFCTECGARELEIGKLRDIYFNRRY